MSTGNTISSSTAGWFVTSGPSSRELFRGLHRAEHGMGEEPFAVSLSDVKTGRMSTAELLVDNFRCDPLGQAFQLQGRLLSAKPDEIVRVEGFYHAVACKGTLTVRD